MEKLKYINPILKANMLIALFLDAVSVGSVLTNDMSISMLKIKGGIVLAITTVIDLICSLAEVKKSENNSRNYIFPIIYIIDLIYMSIMVENAVSSKLYISYSFGLGYYLTWVFVVADIALMVYMKKENKKIENKTEFGKVSNDKYDYDELPPM